MRLFQIDGFSSGPHWDIAIVEAKDEEDARAILAARLADPDNLPDEVWSEHVTPQSVWRVLPTGRPLLFVLGAGCR